MKRLLFLFVFSLSMLQTFAQQQTFDIVTYTAPQGWKADTQQHLMIYSIVDNVKKSWAQIGVFSSTASKGNIDKDFNNEWDELAVKQYKATGLETNETLTSGDWKIKAGGGKFRFNNEDATVMLTTMTGYNVCVSILASTNSADYLTAIQNFIESIDLKKPAGNISTNNEVLVQNNNPHNTSGFAFTTTNFDDGWTSTVNDDYVAVTKGNIKVYLTYPEESKNFAGTGNEARYYYWDYYVSKYFNTGEKLVYPQTTNILNSYDYVEGWCTDKQTGEKRFVGMIVRVIPYTGRLSIVFASAPSDVQFRQQFPKAHLENDNDLKPMYGYNKFAVSKNDLSGTWVSGDESASLTWYSTATGNNVGTTAVARSDEFKFGNNDQYSSTHKGATGWVGAMNTYQQEFKGTYTVSNWNITATNRFEGKTDSYEAWFIALKGGRVLKLKSGASVYTLMREK